jgi:transcriptional regulator with XRE-family HTH domain
MRKRLAREFQRSRFEKNITQEELAFRSGLHRTFISMIERGAKSPTFDSMERIAQALGVKLSELIARAEGSTSESILHN